MSARMRETVAADLDKLGLEVVSFTLKDVTDGSGFIQNMSRPEIARNKQVAEIAEAEAEAARNVTIRQTDTGRESAQARAKADQDRVLAQTLSQAAQAERLSWTQRCKCCPRWRRASPRPTGASATLPTSGRAPARAGA